MAWELINSKVSWLFSCLFILHKWGVVMDEKAKEARNKYMREWREKNKDKVKKAQEKYWEKKAKIS